MNTIIKQATTITTAALLTIGLAACGNGNTANNTANTANTTQNETNKASKPKEKLNPGNWNAWDIKVKHVKTEPNPNNSELDEITEEISIKNLSDETVYTPYMGIKLVTPAGDPEWGNGKGADMWPGSKSLSSFMAEDEEYPTNIAPGETKTFTITLKSGNTKASNDVKNIVFSELKIAHDENELDEISSGVEEVNDLWDGQYCPGENTDGTEEKTEDQCTEKWGPVFDLKTGKKITDYATGKDMSTWYYEDLRPNDTSDWQADMDNYQRAQYKMKLEDLKKKQD